MNDIKSNLSMEEEEAVKPASNLQGLGKTSNIQSPRNVFFQQILQEQVLTEEAINTG